MSSNKDKVRDRLKVEEFPQPSYIHLHHPVLLCHGFGSLASLFKKSPLDDICMLYRSHGIPAYAPNIVPYQTIQVRGEDWCRIIDRVCRETENKRIHVIAHSMGGLDIRHAISHLGMEKHVASLTTVSTPHYGSVLSDWVLKAPNKVRDVLWGIFNRFGNRVYPQIESDVLSAIKQLTPSYMREIFNPSTPDHENVRYFSYGAVCGKGTGTPVNKLLIPFNHHIYDIEGPNDGFVSEQSAHWGEYQATVHLSHLDLIHLTLPKNREKTWREFWMGIVKNLRENRL